MGDTLQDAINALRAAGLSREADAVEELRARHNSTMETFHAAQRASYWSGIEIGRTMTPTPPAPAAVPLTDQQIAHHLAQAGIRAEDYREDGMIVPLVRAIERAHGIGDKP